MKKMYCLTNKYETANKHYLIKDNMKTLEGWLFHSTIWSDGFDHVISSNAIEIYNMRKFDGLRGRFSVKLIFDKKTHDLVTTEYSVSGGRKHVPDDIRDELSHDAGSLLVHLIKAGFVSYRKDSE